MFQDNMPKSTKPESMEKGRQGNIISPPSISLPKGGGAIRGIGEKFAANPVTGTGSMTVPIATSPGRSGFGPQVSLSYDSGSGNGPFGFGWSLSLPQITRKTDKGLPRYLDGQDQTPDSDVFILSGAEDLVPEFEQDGSGNWVFKDGNQVIHDKPRAVNGGTYHVRRHRPRIEGLFARIERWTNQADPADTFWRSISKDNITTWYGKTENSRVFDPNDKSRIFSWLICESHDDKGNVIVYEYKPEDSQNIFKDPQGNSLTLANERNRTDLSRAANRYPKRIRYGNKRPYLPKISADDAWPSPPGAPASDGSKDWLFEVVFDYSEHDANVPQPNDDPAHSNSKPWMAREGPFSSYRAGFEVRTYRLCRRVLMFHHFPDELDGIADYLVRSTEFAYEQTPIASFIRSVTQSGFQYDKDTGKYLKKSLPPLEFEYSKAVINEDIQEIDAESLENLPNGVDGSRYQWVDLDGEGICGILTEQAGAWFYKPNTGGNFGPLERVAFKPSLAALSSGQQQLLDLAGDGQLDLVEFGGPVPGFYERTGDQNWEQFKPFVSLPNIPWHDPNLRFVDLTGDGHADILITEDHIFTWYPSLAEEGFDRAEHVAQAIDEEGGPRLLFADGTQCVYLADLSGDGLSDLVRIRNGEVCYWPNLGYGRFGAKVTMDNSPLFDTPDLFDQKRIHLADIDGSGTTDIIYLHHARVAIYRNECGNSFIDPEYLDNFPPVDDFSSVVAMDLLGNGTACLVWSSALPGDTRRSMRYIALMKEGKPHLLKKTVNNLGAETIVSYAPSTKFYLQDKEDGKPWITRLPFPVQVVERVETNDRISRNRFVTRYAYHHGYFDGVEREFRGFGCVEQWDTEEFAVLSQSGEFPNADHIDVSSHVPPVRTATWFHTGAYLEEEKISQHMAHEYFGAPLETDPEFDDQWSKFEATLLPDTVLPEGILRSTGSRSPYPLTADEQRQAVRALKGSILRQEIYAEDGSMKEALPYSVSERNYTIECLQPQSGNRHAVFFAHPRETIDYHYERKLDPVKGFDPRVTHNAILQVDSFGNVEKSISVGYARRQAFAVEPEQTTALLTLTESTYANKPDEEDWYSIGAAVETHTYEVTRKARDDESTVYSFEDLEGLSREAIAIAYEAKPDRASTQKRLIGQVRTLYRKNDLSGPLALGEIDVPVLIHESYKLAFTAGLANQIFVTSNTNPGKPTPAALADALSQEGGYVHWPGDGNSQPDDHWWIPTGKTYLSPIPLPAPSTITDNSRYASSHFYLPQTLQDPWGNLTRVKYDDFDLLMVETRDSLDNAVTVETSDDQGNKRRRLDYRVLQPYWITDPNGNRSRVAFDVLGMVVATAVMGKPGEKAGDLIPDDYSVDPVQKDIDAFFSDPKKKAPDMLGTATARIVYDLDCFQRSGQPTFAATLARETHFHDPLPPDGLKIQVSFSYSDGFGREIQKKIQAEPGEVEMEDDAGKVTTMDTTPKVRWVASGWTVFNNKGKPIRQYEPFFSIDHGFQFGKKVGVSPILFYDPAERVVATVHPNHTYEKVVFDPWQQVTWDANDTVTLDPRSDEDVRGFFVHSDGTPRLPEEDYLPTWHALRTHPSLATEAAQRWPDQKVREAENKAADQTAVHSVTPTTAYMDSLGRIFLTFAQNRFERRKPDGSVEIISDPPYAARTDLDIEGNQRSVTDALGRVVMRYDYDMLSNRAKQDSMDAGARWALNDVSKRPIHAWDARGHVFKTEYDELRRPIRLWVKGTDTMHSDSRTCSADVLYEQILYGEGQDVSLNLGTRVWKHYDGAGVVTNEKYDFKGNLLLSTRTVADEYKKLYNWAVDKVQSNWEIYSGSTTYDALNRPVEIVAPLCNRTGSKKNTIRPAYNAANLLNSVEANLREEVDAATLLPEWTEFIRNIDYNAKGQRIRIEYGNGAWTEYAYDSETFRLTDLITSRGQKAPPSPDCAPTLDPRTCIDPPAPCSRLTQNRCALQSLHYTYDPEGNITYIRDDAQQTIYFRNKRVEPSGEYTYDAIYRLIEATGREHLGQIGGTPSPHSYNDGPRVGLPWAKNDGNAMGRYIEQYIYDAVGNILSMRHIGTDPANPGWKRCYQYAEGSNRLLSTGDPKDPHNPDSDCPAAYGSNPVLTERYAYDAHGNMTSMPHLPAEDRQSVRLPPLPGMEWDFKDRLLATQQQIRADGGMPQRTYYVYDGFGQRVRKVTENGAGYGVTPTKKSERIYLGGFEVYREYDGPTLERETLHIMDDKQRIALVESRTQGNDHAPQQLIRYQFGNHLGSASLEVDDQAQIISYEEYTPYGSTSYQAVRSGLETNPKRYHCTGKERDEENGFLYHGARYYAPWLGRWTSCDPAYMRSGPNLYEYVLNNPIRFYDADGASAGELADKWAKVSILGWTPGSYVPGLTGEKVVTAAEHFMDRAIGAALDAQPKGNGLLDSMQRVQAEVGATVLKTAGTVLVNVVAGAFIDPGYAARGVLHLGEGAAAGWENVQKGNTALGVSQIVGDVSSAVLTAAPAIKGGLSLVRRVPAGTPRGASPPGEPTKAGGSPLEHLTDEEIERAVQEKPQSGELQKSPAKSDKQIGAEKEAEYKAQRRAREEAEREDRSIAQQNWVLEKYGFWDIEEHSLGGDLGPMAGCWEDEIQPPRPGYDLVTSGDKTVLVRRAQ